MIDVNELRNGVTFLLDEQLYKVLEYSHNKPGRGKATIRIKVRNLRTGEVLEKSFISGSRYRTSASTTAKLNTFMNRTGSTSSWIMTRMSSQ